MRFLKPDFDILIKMLSKVDNFDPSETSLALKLGRSSSEVEWSYHTRLNNALQITQFGWNRNLWIQNEINLLNEAPSKYLITLNKLVVSDMSNKRVRGAPERYVSWEEGDKHAPMALRKKKQLNKAVKQTKLAYQQQYRAREEVKTAQKAYQKEYRERDDMKAAQKAYQKEYREKKKKEKAEQLEKEKS